MGNKEIKNHAVFQHGMKISLKITFIFLDFPSLEMPLVYYLVGKFLLVA